MRNDPDHAPDAPLAARALSIKLLRETADTLEANRMAPPGVVGQLD